MGPGSGARPKLIAFLRAINVGGHIVKMDRLRSLFQELGLEQVETFIASGNVIFSAPVTNIQMLERQIEGHLRQSLGYEVATFIRTASEVAASANYQPFPSVDLAESGNALYIAFLAGQPTTAAQDSLMRFRNDVDDFHIHKREVYWLCRKKMSESRFSGAVLEKALGIPATIRNVTTVKKLAAKYPA